MNVMRKPQKTTGKRHVLFLPGWYDQEMHSGIIRFATANGWALACPFRHEGKIPDFWQGDGIITLLSEGRPDVTEYVCARRPMPVVDMANNLPHVALPRVLQDNCGIGQAAAMNLLSHGCRHFVYFKLHYDYFSNEREEGFRQAVRRHGATLAVFDASGLKIQRNRVSQWLAGQLLPLPRPLGIMAASDDITDIVFEACRLADIKIPDGAMLIGVDNDEFICETTPVPLSSVDNNRELHGYRTARLLNHLMNGKPPPRTHLVVEHGQVFERQSTNNLAVTNPLVARAIRLIWSRYADPEFSATSVINDVHLTRVGLHRLFTRYIGRSVADEIRRKRMEHATALLRNTQKKMEDVASVSGFSSAIQLNKVLNREQGRSPSTIRKERGSIHSPVL